MNEGTDQDEVLRLLLEVADSTWNTWRAWYGGMTAKVAKRCGSSGPRTSMIAGLVDVGEPPELEILESGVGPEEVLLGLVLAVGEDVDPKDDPLVRVDLAFESGEAVSALSDTKHPLSMSP